MTVAPDSIFERIVVGVDGTEAGFEACRQVARLALPGGAIDAVTAPPGDATALERALEILGDRARGHRLDDAAAPALLEELDRFDATLIALGTHEHGRVTEILFGGVGGEILHRSPASVLVARQCAVAAFPRRIVVGHDGSPCSDRALAAAEELAERFESRVLVISALAGRIGDVGHIRGHDRHVVMQHPVVALIDAGRDADLLVVGSRGLHGPKALGSVSERVAHDATCSVLVVRGSGGAADTAEPSP